MEINFRDFDFPIKDGRFDFGMFLLVLSGYSGNQNINREISSMKEGEVLKVKSSSIGKRLRYLINANGFLRFLERSKKVLPFEKKDLITQLKQLSLIDSSVILSHSSLESKMASSLIQFFQPLSIKVETQIPFNDKYLLDFKVNNFIIEFDEHNHIGYNKNIESVRDRAISSAGFKLIRISSNNSNEYNLGVIAKEFFKW